MEKRGSHAEENEPDAVTRQAPQQLALSGGEREVVHGSSHDEGVPRVKERDNRARDIRRRDRLPDAARRWRERGASDARIRLPMRAPPGRVGATSQTESRRSRLSIAWHARQRAATSRSSSPSSQLLTFLARAVCYSAAVGEAASVDRLLGPRVTLEEWIALAEDVPGEFVDGRLVEEEVPDYLHEVLVAWLARVLGNWAETADAIVGASDAKFTVSPTRGRKADLTVYLAGRRPPPRGAIAVPPDIAVEIVSPSPRDQRRDRVDKMEEYARFGIRFYWLIDPLQRSVEIYEQTQNGGYVRRLQASGRTIAQVPGCSGLTLDVDAMWRKIDAFEEPR